MKQKNELGAMLMAAVLLLLCVSYMTQCSSVTRRPETVAAATPSASQPVSREEEDERERKAEHKPKSIHEFAAEEENEERAKIKGISRALQTIAADPELRRTYGFPQ